MTIAYLQSRFRALMDGWGDASVTLSRPGGVTVNVTAHRLATRLLDEDQLQDEMGQKSAAWRFGHDELVENGFPVPPRRGDKIFEDSTTFTLSGDVRVLKAANVILGYECLSEG